MGGGKRVGIGGGVAGGRRAAKVGRGGGHKFGRERAVSLKDGEGNVIIFYIDLNCPVNTCVTKGLAGDKM